jgi:hypothetical protein
MARKKPEKIEIDWYYDENLPAPADLYTFIESEVFRVAWKRCGLADGDLFNLQLSIIAYPKSGALVQGTGGVRKLRLSPTGSGRGKSGSHRVLDCYFEEYGTVLLVTAYPKGRQDDISMAGKKIIKKLIERQNRRFNEGPIQ